jgi:hypothetical protein
MSIEKYIKSITLYNIQSWADASDPIKLSDDKINIIEAPNETGKSVVFKILYTMIWPNYFGINGRRTLLRRGANKGCAYFKRYDGIEIAYLFTANSQVYALRKPPEKFKVWSQNQPPEEVVEALGLYVDYDARIILNVHNANSALPFVTTSLQFNALLLKSITEFPEIQQAIDNLSVWLKDLKGAMNTQSKNVIAARSRNSMIDFVSTESLRYHLNKCKEYREFLVNADICDTEINKLFKLTTEEKPQQDIYDLKLGKELILVCENTQITDSTLSDLYTLVSNKPNELEPCDYNSANLILEVFKESEGVISGIIILNELISNKPELIKGNLSICDMIISVNNQTIYGEYQLKNYFSTYYDKQRVVRKLSDINIEIHNLEVKLKVCPVCKKPF